MSSVRSEHECANGLPVSPRFGLSHAAPGLSSRSGRFAGAGAALADPCRSRCVVVLGSAAPVPLDKVVHRVTGMCVHQANVRRARCAPEDTSAEHSVLQRLFDECGDADPPAWRAGDAAVAAFDRLVAEAPVVLVVTDAHWCDDGTLRWLDRLMRHACDEPLTVVMTSSRGLLTSAGPALHEIVAREYCAVTGIAELLPTHAAHPAGADFAYLVRHEPELLRVARAAAVLRSTDADLVGALSGLPAHVVVKALRTAWSVGMVPDPMPPASVPHLVDALPATLPRAERDRMYAKAAEILNDAAHPAEQVADILLAQPVLDHPWMTALLKEAAAATERLGPATAARYLTRLHRLDPNDAAVRADLAAALLDIDPVSAREHLDRVRGRGGDPDLTARTTVPLRLTALMTHLVPEVPSQLDAFLDDLRPEPDGTPLPTDPAVTPAAGPAATPNSPRTAGHLRAAGEGPSAPPPATVTPATMTPTTMTPSPVTPSTVAQAAVPQAGTAAGRLTLAARATRAALSGTGMQEAVGDAYQVLRAEAPHSAWATVAAARVLGLADHTASALDHLARAITDSQRRKEVWAECHARSARAWLLFQMGELTEAAAQARAALRIAQSHDWPAQARLPIVVLARTMLARSETDRAESTLRGLEGERFEDSVWEYHNYLMATALLHLRHGRPEQAWRSLEACGASLEAAGIDNPVFTTWWVVGADVLARAGRTGDAAGLVEGGRRLVQRWPTRRGAGLGLLAAGMAAQGADRVELLTESIRELAASPDRPFHTFAELRLGHTLFELGDKKAARTHLHVARTLAGQHGLLVLAERAHDILATAGGRAPAAEPGAPAALTAAERPVAELAAGGATNREIADVLCLTVRTVEYHLTKIYRKLGVTGRSDLAEHVDPDGGPEPSRAPGDPR